MTTHRIQYRLRCGSMITDFKSKKPTMTDLDLFVKQNSPTNNDIVIEKYTIKVDTIGVSRVSKKHPNIRTFIPALEAS